MSYRKIGTCEECGKEFGWSMGHPPEWNKWAFEPKDMAPSQRWWFSFGTLCPVCAPSFDEWMQEQAISEGETIGGNQLKQRVFTDAYRPIGERFYAMRWNTSQRGYGWIIFGIDKYWHYIVAHNLSWFLAELYVNRLNRITRICAGEEVPGREGPGEQAVPNRWTSRWGEE